MKKRVITVLVPIVLICIVIAVALGAQIIERYSYSKNRADLNEYFNIAQADEVAMVVQDTLVEEKALLRGGVVYFALSTVETYFTDRFYVNSMEQVLLFTTDTDVIRIHIGDDSNVMYVSDAGQELDYQAAFYEGDTLYIAADYVKRYANLTIWYTMNRCTCRFIQRGAATQRQRSPERRHCAIRAASRVIF